MSLLKVFVADAGERVRRLRESVAQDAIASLVREAHTLKGGAVTAGLGRAAALAEELELALERGDRDAAREAIAALAAEVETAQAAVRTVLVIEDDPTSLLLVERTAARVPGVRLLTARTGSDGVEVARTERPDVVLLDGSLPDLAAEEVLARLAADPATADVPVAVVSADARVERIAELRAAGTVEYLTKPLDVERLLAILAGAE